MPAKTSSDKLRPRVACERRGASRDRVKRGWREDAPHELGLRCGPQVGRRREANGVRRARENEQDVKSEGAGRR
eukprot:1165505-Pleurochrysis_carterae.AAC.2